jgi:hypothetical protein
VKTRLILLAAIAAFFGLAPREASAVVCTIPYTFVNGTAANANQVNSNFTSLQSCSNNIDNTNLGTVGIFASQIVPTTVAQATFGGTQTYVFPLGLDSANNIMTTSNANGYYLTRLGGGVSVLDAQQIVVNGVTADLLRIGNGGGGSLFAFDNVGNEGVVGQLTAANIKDTALTASRCVQTSGANIFTSAANTCVVVPTSVQTGTTSGTCATNTLCSGTLASCTVSAPATTWSLGTTTTTQYLSTLASAPRNGIAGTSYQLYNVSGSTVPSGIAWSIGCT